MSKRRKELKKIIEDLEDQIAHWEEPTQEDEGEYVSLVDEDGNWETYWMPVKN